MGEQVTFASNGDTADGYLAVPAVPWEKTSPEWPSYAGKTAMIHPAEGDGGPEADGVRQARAAVEAAGGRVEVHGYPGTRHAFFHDTRPEVHDPAAAAAAWDRTVALFREAL